jgi:hypothetical protein
MTGNLHKQVQATGPVYDLIAAMRRIGALLHSPASKAPDGTLSPTGQMALEQLEDAIAELLSEDVEPAGLADMQALTVYAQARVTFAMQALGEADFDRTEDHLFAVLVLLGKVSRSLEQTTGITAEHLGEQTLN